ncbi:MAG TPA: sugar phosphate isomerase/epimerase, partial [Thermomicrobiales bacterium]|nr:sugar phosphate isomerase/epimerase [Thermomicrobiales bacterium]
MHLGIFETTFTRPSLGETLDAVVAHGLRAIQLDVASAGLASMPDAIPDETIAEIRKETAAREIQIAGVLGTWNMIHPDVAERRAGLESLRAIAATCHELGTSVITICTGTRDRDSMWRRHPDNNAPEAWDDLLETLGAALVIADEHDVVLAFEPEPANVINAATKGRALLDTLRHPRLKVTMDPANVVATDRTREPLAVLEEAFGLLGGDIAIAHAKDLDAEGHFCAVGTGIVPWGDCLRLFRDAGYHGPLILHSLREDQVEHAMRALTRNEVSQPRTWCAGAVGNKP